MDYLSMTLLCMVGIFLILIILLQRGRGGGLAGAFGGLGGQSAFGTKAGDVFTKITVALAVLWVALAGLSGFALRAGSEGRYKAEEKIEDSTTSTEQDGEKEPEVRKVDAADSKNADDSKSDEKDDGQLDSKKETGESDDESSKNENDDSTNGDDSETDDSESPSSKSNE